MRLAVLPAEVARERTRAQRPGATATRCQIIRKRWAKVVEAGDAYYAPRCGKWISPNEPWDLGHDDTDRTKYRGPEHRACNRGAPDQAEVPRRQSREW